MLPSESQRLKVVVLISGTGSNLQAIIDRSAQPDTAFEIVAVISNKREATGLQRAKKANIPHHVCAHKHFPSRDSFDRELKQLIDQYHPGLVVLAGFMRILGDEFVQHYQGRLINIHPALLPKFQGLNTHQRVLDANEIEHGASVHFVNESLDSGPVIAHSRVPILATDDAHSLASRVLGKEHLLYPTVIQWIAQHRLQWQDGEIWFDGQILTQARRL